ncbi:GvpL/GvpF family gas vesicle protein [Promicromonospora sp. MEB111]|uniref:GvpL/GvpF family gas vesicle protein n=1 Tax=Promicromonospora sp. MEB111 TaxID=3040301 RepID=UPI00254AEFEE|nr:GvpL/GvpF family gas vesicle protein [Promicromonospora sp. MEB111]
MTADRLYLYGIAIAEPDDLGTGIAGAPLRAVTGVEGMTAVVHEHDGGPFQGADADVERWVVEHSTVVEQVWRSVGTVLPASFNVIVAPTVQVTARQRLLDWLTSHADPLRARLAALQGRVELRVEIGLDNHLVAENHPEVVAARSELEGRSPGVQRLLHKRLDHLERDITAATARDRYADYLQRLEGASEDLDENLRARPEPGTALVLSVSLLVPADSVDEVGLVLAAVQDEEPAARIRFLGPWPPYSFADVLGLSPLLAGDSGDDQAG